MLASQKPLEQELRETKIEAYIRGRKYVESGCAALTPLEQIRFARDLIVRGEPDFQLAFVEWFQKGYTRGILECLGVPVEEPLWYQPYVEACQFLGTYHLKKTLAKVWGDYDLYWTEVGLYHSQVIARWGDFEYHQFRGIPTSIDILKYSPDHPFCVAFLRAKKVGYFKRAIKTY